MQTFQLFITVNSRPELYPLEKNVEYRKYRYILYIRNIEKISEKSFFDLKNLNLNTEAKV